MTMLMALKTTKGRQKGVAIIELAILLVFLLLLTIGITEIGRAFWYYSALQKATREGARYVSMQPWTGSNPVIDCINLVREDAHAAGVPLEDDNIKCTWDSSGGWGGSETRPSYIKVSIVDYQMNWIWSLGAPLPEPGGSAPLAVQTTMPYMK